MAGSSPASVHEGKASQSYNAVEEEYPIIVHSMVEVLPRTWPGINKPGGAARVTQLYYQQQDQHEEDGKSNSDINKEDTKTLTHVDVRYVVMGGREKRVPIEFCVAAPQYDTHLLADMNTNASKFVTYEGGAANRNATSVTSSGDPKAEILTSALRSRFSRLRDRSALLGRCKRCGSLRSDCNSCDWAYEEMERKRMMELEAQKSNMSELRENSEKQHSEELKHKSRKKKRIIQSSKRKRKETAMGESYLGSSSSSSSSAASEDEGHLYHAYSQIGQERNIIDDSTGSNDDLYSFQRSPEYVSSSENSSSEEDIILSELNLLSKKLTIANQLAQRLTQKPKKTARSYLRERQQKLKPRYKRSKRLIPNQKNFIGDDKLSLINIQNIETRMSSTSEPINGVGAGAAEQDTCNNGNNGTKSDITLLDNVALSPRCQNASSNRLVGYVHDSDIGENEDDNDDRHISFSHDDAPQRNHDLTVTDDIDIIHDHQTAYDAMFIQPEGDKAAFDLPSDVVDKTANVPLLKLVDFFVETLQKIRESSIPRAERNLAEMRQTFLFARGDITESRREGLIALETSGWMDYDRLCMELIRDGTDQCRAALTRLWNRKNFRSATSHLSMLERKRLKRVVFENFDLQLDAIQDKVELILREIREILYDSSFDVDQHIRYTSDDMSSSKDDDDDDDDTRNFRSIHEKDTRLRSGPHPHAQIRSTNADTYKSRNSKKFPNNGRGSRKVKRGVYGSRKVEVDASKSSTSIDKVTKFNARKFRNSKKRKRNRKTWRDNDGSHHTVELKRKQRRSHRDAHLYEPNDEGQNFHASPEINSNGQQLHAPVSVDKDMSHPISRPSNNSISLVRESEIGGDFIFLSEEGLFIDLIDEDSDSPLQTDSLIPQRSTHSMPALELCEKLAQCYLDDKTRASELLKQIPYSFTREKGDKRESALGIFQIMLSLLQRYGAKSLQEMIQTMNDDFVVVHMNLLSSIAKLLELNAHSHLLVDDGLVYQVFSTRGSNCILELAVLQMLDILYSQLLPDCWGKPKLVSRTVFISFLSLRDAIGKLTHLTELVSISLSARLECQQWRRAIPLFGQNNNDNEKWFVSAIDSDGVLKSFKNGAKSIAKGKNRFGQFRKCFPRKEIEAIWGILAFFAVFDGNIKEVSTSVRWKLLSSLFFYQTGTLGPVDTTLSSLNPSDTQINRCIVEIQQLKTFVLSRAFHPLPSDSTFVMKLVQKAIYLDVKSKSFKTAFEKKYHSEMKKNDFRFIFEVWGESNLWECGPAQEATESLVETLMKQSDFDDSFEKESIFTLSPLTLLTQLSISLIEVWIAAYPNKNARWARLDDSLSSLLTKLSDTCEAFAVPVKDGNEMNKNANDEGKTFAKAFSNIALKRETHDLSLVIASREATAMVIIGVLRARAKYERKSNTTIPLPTGNYDIKICKQLWCLVSDHFLQGFQNYLTKMTPSSPANLEESTIDTTLSAIKVMTSYLLHQLRHTDESIFSGESRKGTTSLCKENQEVYEFSFSCILAGIMTLTQHLKALATSSQGIGFIPTQSQAEVLKCANALSSGFTWLALIMKYANRIADRIILSPDHISDFPPLKFYQNKLQSVEAAVIACIRVIIRSMHSSSSFEACLRSCLTVIRSSVMAAHSYTRLSNHKNKRDSNQQDSCQNGSNNLSDIDDEAFMSIDLDALQFDSIARGELWNLLFQLLQKSQPSSIYALKSSAFGESSDVNGSSSFGRAMCAKHSGAICATLASLCTLRINLSVNDIFSSLFNDSSQPSTSSSGSPGGGSDAQYRRHVEQCLCAELSQLTRCFHSCHNLVFGGGIIFLEKIICAMLDANTLNRFPSENIKLMMSVGGKRSKEKEQARLLYVNASCNSATKRGFQSCDIEAIGIHRQKNDVFDTPGPSYMTQRLWSFCSNLGHCLKENIVQNGVRTQLLPNVGLALVDNNIDLDGTLKDACNETLEKMSKISLERECMKRIVKIRSFFTAYFNNCKGEKNIIGEHKALLALVIKRLLEDLDTIALGVQYYEQNSSLEESYLHAKARCLQNAYCQLAVSLSLFLIKEIFSSGATWATSHALFLFDHFVFPSLMREGLHTSSDMKRAAASIIAFDIYPSIQSNPRGRQSIAADLFLTVSRRIKEVIMCISYESSTEKRKSKYFQLLSSMFAPEKQDALLSMETVIEMIISALINGMNKRTVSTSSDLSSVLDIYFSLVFVSNDHHDQRITDTTSEFRTFTLRSFMLPKLNQVGLSMEKKEILLRILNEIIDVKSLAKNFIFQYCCDDIGIENGDHDIVTSSYLGFKSDICSVAHSLGKCLQFDLLKVQFSMISDIYKCAKSLIKLKINGQRLLQWCNLNKAQNTHASYMLIFCEWSSQIATLLSGVLHEEFLTQFARRYNGDSVIDIASLAEREDVIHFKLWLHLDHQKSCMEREIFKAPTSSSVVKNIYARWTETTGTRNDTSGGKTEFSTLSRDSIREFKAEYANEMEVLD